MSFVPMTKEGWFQGTHILFAMVEVGNRKTKLWHVYNKHEINENRDSGLLGRVQWFSRWRKYAFYPAEGCVFEEVCMREISEFIETRTRKHKDGIRSRAA